MYAYDYVGMGSGPQKLICFALKARYEIMLLISFWTSLGIYIKRVGWSPCPLNVEQGSQALRLSVFPPDIGGTAQNLPVFHR